MSLERDIEFLRNLPLLSELTSDQLRLLAFGADFRITRKGEVLFKRGDFADSGLLVKSGLIGLYTSDDADAEPDEIIEPGALIGELALIIDTRRAVRAVALERSELLQIRRALFRRMLEEFPSIARCVRQNLVGRISNFAHDLAPVADALDHIDAEHGARRSARNGGQS